MFSDALSGARRYRLMPNFQGAIIESGRSLPEMSMPGHRREQLMNKAEFKKWRQVVMSNVVSINRGKVLEAYLDAQGVGLDNEDAYFYVGVLSSLVLPQYVLFVYGGFLALTAFAITGVVGLTLGVARYYWLPYRLVSCLDKEAEVRMPRTYTQNKKAA
jgi:hypothetical protein